MKPARTKHEAIEVPAETSKLPAKVEPMPAAAVEAGSPLDLPPAQFKAALDRRKENRKSLMDWIRDALVEGTDFARIHVVGKQRCGLGNQCKNPAHYSKPTLLKPGAEKICGMLGITPTFPRLTDYEQACLEGTEIKQVILRCEMHNSGNQVVAYGVGARNSGEDYGDLNKTLKMAEKRAMLDAVLRLGGLSEVFTQDQEDEFASREFQEPAQERLNRSEEYLPSSAGSAGSQPAAATESTSSKNETAAPTRSPLPQKPAGQPGKVKLPTAKWRDKLIRELKADPGGENQRDATEYFRKAGALLPTEELIDLPLEFVPANPDQMRLLQATLEDFKAGNPAVLAFRNGLVLEPEKPQDAPKPSAAPPAAQKPQAAHAAQTQSGNWESFPFPFGKNAGKPLSQLDEKWLYTLCMDYEVKTSFEGTDGKQHARRPDQIAKDRKLREMLDAAAAAKGWDRESKA